MKADTIFYCEGPDCQRHAQTASKRPMMFMEVTEHVGAEPMYFCGWDCAMKYGATLPPEEVHPLGGPEDMNAS